MEAWKTEIVGALASFATYDKQYQMFLQIDTDKDIPVGRLLTTYIWR